MSLSVPRERAEASITRRDSSASGDSTSSLRNSARMGPTYQSARAEVDVNMDRPFQFASVQIAHGTKPPPDGETRFAPVSPFTLFMPERGTQGRDIS